MVELSDKRRITKTPIYYKQVIEQIYPKENVKAMMESWQKTIDNANEYINNADDTLKSALEQGFSRIDHQGQKIKDRIAELTSLSPEDRAKKLLEEFDVFVKMQETQLAEIEKAKAQFKKELEEQHRQQIEKHKMERKEKEDAINAWKNAIPE